MGALRSAAVAGRWYPGEPRALGREVDEYIGRVRQRAPACPRAIIAPHAGLMYSGPVAAYAYAAVGRCDYAAAVLVGPSHFVRFDGVSVWPEGAWTTPFGSTPIAVDLAAMLQASSREVIDLAEPHGREHSLEMQLPFLARLLPDVPIVPLLMGQQTREAAEQLGDALARAVSQYEAGGRRVLLVASSDLSHYHDAETAARLDDVVLDRVEAFDADGLMQALEREPHHACGGAPMVAVMRAARALDAAAARVLHYADSGDVSGDKASVVGYMAAALW